MAIITVAKSEWSEQYTRAMSYCSSNIKKFLTALNAKDDTIDWAMLDRNGFKFSDGSYFRVISSLRGGEEQNKLFKQGRSGVVFNKYDNINGVMPFHGVRYYCGNRGTIVNNNDVCTYAIGGESYHNWGLAVDICFRLLGENKKVIIDGKTLDFEEFYALSGILKLAEKCHLNWGTKVNFRADMTHFEDSQDYKIPPKEFHYLENMNGDFIEWYYGTYLKSGITSESLESGEVSGDTSKKSVRSLAFVFAGVVAVCSVVYFLFLKKKGRY